MEAPVGFQEWELLQTSETAAPPPPPPKDDRREGLDGGEEGNSDDGISPDYFALDSGKRHHEATACEEEESLSSLARSENPSWIDPNSESWYSGKRERGDLSWSSGESSDGREEDFGELGAGSESSEGSSDDHGREFRAEDGRQEKTWTAWWKLPFEVLKVYASKVRPVWSISIAAAVLGFIMLGQKLYKMKRRSRSIPTNISTHDKKKASQFMVHATRLNEAFSVMKRRTPITKTTLPTPSVNPWPAVAFK